MVCKGFVFYRLILKEKEEKNSEVGDLKISFGAFNLEIKSGVGKLRRFSTKTA